jgi:hypothetical protein
MRQTILRGRVVEMGTRGTFGGALACDLAS